MSGTSDMLPAPCDASDHRESSPDTETAVEGACATSQQPTRERQTPQRGARSGAVRPSVDTESMLRRARAPARLAPSSEKAQWHDLDGLAIQRNDVQHTLIVDGFWIRLT